MGSKFLSVCFPNVLKHETLNRFKTLGEQILNNPENTPQNPGFGGGFFKPITNPQFVSKHPNNFFETSFDLAGEQVLVYRPSGHILFFRPLTFGQKPTKKSAKSLFFALFATVCKNLNRVAEPAGTGQYFTSRDSNGIERASFCFGDHMNNPRPPADQRISAVAKNS